MASLNQSASMLAERLGRQFDIPFQEEIKLLIKCTGARFLKDSLAKRSQDRKFFIQSFVANVISVDLIDCPIKYGCTLRTALKIPRPLRANSALFDFVGTADFSEGFSPGGDWKETYLKHNLYTSEKPRFLYRDQYIFISDSTNSIEYIGVQGIFEDFSLLSQFKCTDNCDINDDNDYPISADILDMVYLSLLKGQLSVQSNEEDPEIKVNG